MKPIIAITTGDTNGIGYEVIIKALLEAHMFELFKPVIYGNAVVAKHHIQTLGDYWRNINWNIIDTPEQAKELTADDFTQTDAEDPFEKKS